MQIVNKVEIKIYILYVMKNIGYPCEYSDICEACTSDGVVNYFSFAESFSELIATFNVEQVPTDDGKETFMITDRGINVAENLLYRLVPGVQRSALAAATRYVSFKERGCVVEYTDNKREDGKFDLDFRVKERGEVIFSISLVIENEEQLKRIKYNLSHKSDGVYKNVMALLCGDASYLLDS